MGVAIDGWLKVLFDESPIAIAVTRRGVVVDGNAAYVSLFGYDSLDELRGQSLLVLVAPSRRQEIIDFLAQRARGERIDNTYESRALRKDGTEFPLEVTAKNVVVSGETLTIGFFFDLTKREELAERVRHAQKLESLGVLAGGIAHDFNNILTVIKNAVAVAKSERDPTTVAEQLDVVGVAAERAAELSRQMLAYAGKGSLTQTEVDLSAVVAEMAKMLEGSVRTRAKLVHELAADLPVVLGDATQIGQVVMNVVLNAVEATTTPHGTVFVSTGVETRTLDALATSVAGGDPKPGTYVHVEVRDAGVGMDAATITKMFDPFFTTKFVGRGLGMAAALGIVRGHGGVIEVDSKPGFGTRIRVSLPASKQSTPLASALRTATEHRGQGLVLLVDDDENVRRTTRLLLEGFGFDVMLARDGSEAIEVFRSRCREIGAVVLDLTMPKMDGFEVLTHLRRAEPRVPVVLTSGYGVMPSREERGPTLEPDAVLGKPYTSEELFLTLKKVMRSAGRPAGTNEGW